MEQLLVGAAVQARDVGVVVWPVLMVVIGAGQKFMLISIIIIRAWK